MQSSLPKPNMEALSELKSRVLFVLMALLVFRLGAHIPVANLDPARLADLFRDPQNSILGWFNVFSGGALQRFSLFATGIMPYISASIIMQMMSMVLPSLEQIKKEGENGRRKINQYTRYLTVVFAVFQAIGMAKYLVSAGVALTAGLGFYITTVCTLVTGTLFLMWLGEQITERGIGNGISLIIFAGIVSGIPSAIVNTVEQVRQGLLQPIALIVLLAVMFAIICAVVFIERGQRRISVQYAKRSDGRTLSAANRSHLPFKINMAGVIPPIFASTLLLFPATICQWFGGEEGLLVEFGEMLRPGQPLYLIFLAAGIMFFCFFYTALIYNPREMAENLKRSGAFVPGIRPGDQTAGFIDRVLTRLTLMGGIYITLVALLPELLNAWWQVPFYFGGTSLLIVVVVVMDFMAQVQAQMMSKQYESLMRKASKGKNDSKFGLLH